MEAVHTVSSGGERFQRRAPRHANTLNTLPCYQARQKRGLARRSRENALLLALVRAGSGCGDSSPMPAA
jgi:hypothetical protein